MIVVSRIDYTIKNLRLMILEPTMITSQIQSVQNSCSKKLPSMQFSEFNFIVQKNAAILKRFKALY